MKKIIIIILIFFPIILNADERDNKLDTLFNELKINNASLAKEIEKKIWNIWITHPTNNNLTINLSEGSRLIKDQQLLKAVKVFTEVIQKDPTWAEAWNKRATVLYLLGKYEDSQKDIENVLKLERRHFGALAGQGLVNIKLQNYEKAIKSYQKVQEIYPSMESSQIMIYQIEQLIKQQLI
tara:strand:- start:383 stop:925 length:543 start_codon:yes stop_codon:yes gene_type:complete